MDSILKYYYEQCEECEFSDFQDYDNMKCLKSVKFNEEVQCAEFKKFNQQIDENIIVSGKANSIIEEIKEIEHEELKSRKSEIVLIEAEKKDGDESENDYRLNTIEAIDVYGSTDIGIGNIIKKEPKNKLIPFHRELIRHGRDLIMIKEPDGGKVYLEKDTKRLAICQQCKVKDRPLDVLLMSHNDFDKYTNSQKIEVRRIDDKYSNDIESCVTKEQGMTFARVIDEYKKDGKYISVLNTIFFRAEIAEIRIGEMEMGTNFYITNSEGDKKPKKIKIFDGREAILISSAETYRPILPPLQQFINAIIILLTLIIVFGGIYAIFDSTGYVIIIGIIVIPIIFLITIFVGLPLQLLLNQIIKRL